MGWRAQSSAGLILALLLPSCGGADGPDSEEQGPDHLVFEGGRIDGSDDPVEPSAAPEPGSVGDGDSRAGAALPVAAAVGGSDAQVAPVPTAPVAPEAGSNGRISIKFSNLSLDELDDVQLEDLLDALLYPDEYEEADRTFPPQIQALDGKEVALEGYMIPVVWEETEVVEFMLVRDLLACCFGGAPQPDEWVSVKMPAGQGSEYYSFVPIVVQGVFHIAALEDEAGYAAGCYRMDGESVRKIL